MKSTQENLEKRGFLEPGLENEHQDLSAEHKMALLESKIPKERTIGARLLSQEQGYVADRLIEALKNERKLYPKIEICKALEFHQKDAVSLLVKELGKIGANQLGNVPDKEFGKDNYPLPRDIAARTLAHIGKSALPDLLQVLEYNDTSQISEAIDAIGFICFYDYQANVYERLIQCYSKNNRNELISWKIFRAMSGLPESSVFLTAKLAVCPNERIKKEIIRSLRLIEKRK